MATPAGASYAGVAASERLHSAKSQLERARKVSTAAEQDLNAMEVKSIHAVSSHAKDTSNTRQKTQKQPEEYDDDKYSNDS